jgi:hypothetical protein
MNRSILHAMNEENARFYEKVGTKAIKIVNNVRPKTDDENVSLKYIGSNGDARSTKT